MNLLDWFKQKITPKSVGERQTDAPRMGQLHREFAGHPAKGLTPADLASILAQAEQGDMIAQAELFMDMEENDAHIAAELSKRKMVVKKLDWTLEPPRDASAKEKKATKTLELLIRDELDIDDLRLDLLDAIGHGYSCVELGWGRTQAGLWFPNRVEHRPPSWFTCHPDDRNTLRLRDSSQTYGAPLQPWGWIPHTHKSRSGYLARAGLHRVLAWPYLFKNYSVRDLAEFLEIYGLPIRIGKYGPNAGDKEKRDLLKAVLSIGHHAAGIIPESMAIELATVTGGGNGGQSFQVMIDWCEASESKAILGGTLTTSTAANGNRSLGDVHNEVRMDIRDDDAKQTDQSLSLYLVYPMAMLNGLFADNRSPSFVSDTQEPDDLALYSDALPKLTAIGMKIPARYAYQKLKIPEPEGDEPVLSTTQPAPMDQSNTPPATAAAHVKLAALSSQTEQLTPPELMVDRLAQDTAIPGRAWMDKIMAMVDAAESLEQLRDMLLNAYADLDSEDMTNVMALAFAAADLAGRFDVQQGN
jgi:phage gp29-like protein